jgi:hypothetical protein
MNEENAILFAESVIDEMPAAETTAEPHAAKVQELIPRHQNKMVAERTTDMYMSGQMCE